MDTELAYTPVTQAYGHSHESQYIILACCANHISAECCQWRGGGGLLLWFPQLVGQELFVSGFMLAINPSVRISAPAGVQEMFNC